MKKGFKIAVTVAPLVALALLAAYVIYHIISLAPRDNFALVKKATLEEKIALDGFLFRDETVLTSSGGIEKLYYSDGEKIAAGAVVASNGNDIISEKSGYFYSDVDGYEALFTADAALALDIENFDRITTENPFDDSKHAKPTQPIGAFGKVATDFVWYFAVKTDKTDRFDLGEEYAAAFGGESVTLKLIKRSDGEKSSVLVFRCDEMPRGIVFKRAMTGEITVAVHSGTAVPSDAVYYIDKSTYIYIFDDGYARRRAANFVFEKDGVCIVESKFINEGDLVLIGKNLYDGKVMH
ncbi:MAG: hypothetical protein IKP68_02930 [Clostridia bacterium]|nr:hypothetical protein [Clostridia bacterium]